MSIRSITAVIVTIATCITLQSCNNDTSMQCDVVDFPHEVPEFQAQLLEEAGYGSFDRVRVCKIGSYLVYAPEDAVDQTLFIRTEQETVAVIMPNGDVSIFKDDRPLVDLYDRDDDGSFDWLSYEIYRDGDDGSLVIVDNNLDGQADHKYERATGDGRKGWLWFDGSWRPQKWLNAPEPNRILVDGVWRRHERGVEGELVLLDD